MPILVKDFTWEETESCVWITVPLKGVKASKVDIFNTDEYVKVSYPPYLFEAFLFSGVDDAHGKASVGSGVVLFQLDKKQAVLWNQLQATEAQDKEFMKRKREEAVQRAHTKAQEEKERRAKEKREDDRHAVREQMRLDEQERKRIEALKEAEREKATEELEQWKEKHRQTNQEMCQVVDEMQKARVVEIEESSAGMTRYDADDETDGKWQDAAKDRKSQKKSQKQQPLRRLRETKKNVFDEKPLPEVRFGGKIEVSFTPRAFTTPSRESKAPEEEEWLKKVAEAGRMKDAAVNNPDAVDAEEMNPLWLKDKGSGFFKSGNYVAAINAFTAAIVLNGSIPSLYSNRAACHLQLKQHKECIQDCTSALELLVPPVAANASSRCKALVRRGTACFFMEDYVQALKDYEDALKLNPQNEDLRADAERIRKIIQGTE